MIANLPQRLSVKLYFFLFLNQFHPTTRPFLAPKLIILINPFELRVQKIKSANLTLNLLNGLILKEVICLYAHYSVLWGFMGEWGPCLHFMMIRP